MTDQSAAGNPADVQSIFFDPAVLANPFSLFEQLRSTGSIIQIPMPFAPETQTAWLVTQFAEAVQVLKDRRFVVSGGIGNTGDPSVPEIPGFLAGRTMVNMNEPDHTRLRNLVSKAFTPRYIEGLRPRIQALAEELLDRVVMNGVMDLVHDYAFPLPITVISEMLGVPLEDRHQIRDWSAAVAGGSFAERDPRWFVQMADFVNYIRRLVATKRQNPQEDLISQLIQTQEAGDHLSEQELIDMVGLLIFAGHETTSNLISIGTLMLLDRPEQLTKLRANMSLISTAIEELLRFHGPVSAIAPRFAAEDVEIGSQQIRKGDMVMILLASANRDHAQFAEADEVDVARSLNRHIAFGQGIHYCLGAPLARLEAEIAFTMLLRRMSNLRLNAPRETLRWRGDLFLRGLASLPVAF
jgi:cytochrome P450